MPWDEEERFSNPYNFVPFEGICQRADVPYKPGNLTGYLECTLELLTPLFIPNTSNDKALHRVSVVDNPEASSYDFFSYENLSGRGIGGCIHRKDSEPVIPGSEMRGAVRSVFEAAFNGCMSVVEKDRPLGRRTTQPKIPGIMRKNTVGWEIVPCRRWMLNTTIKTKDSHEESRFGKYVEPEDYESWREGQILHMKPGGNYITSRGHNTKCPVVADWSVEKVQGWQKGYLHKGEWYLNKHHESVFIPLERAKPIPVSDTDVRRLCEVLRQYRNPKTNRTEEHKGYKKYRMEGQEILVYYNEGFPLYLSPACIGKEVFQQSIGRLLESIGGYQPCQRRDAVCPACALFGMIGRQAPFQSRASRVRFGDGRLMDPPSDMSECYLPDITLPELGEPKPGTVEFYILPTTEKGTSPYGYWTYDYEMRYEDGENKKSERVSLNSNQPQLRGRKFYWHSSVEAKYLQNQEPLSPMNQRIRPMDHRREGKNVVFQFHVYFENIKKEELKQLAWALTFGEPDCAHKLGRGKPLGFGSVRIGIDKIYLRTIDKKTGEWKCTLLQNFDHSLPITKSMQILQLLASWEKRPKSVSYPLGKGKKSGENQEASHQWFRGNRERIPGYPATRPNFAKVLPKPEEEVSPTSQNKWLYKLVEKDKPR